MLSQALGLRALEWLMTYSVHSTVLLGGAWFLTTRRGVRSERVREMIWKTAIVGGVLTALVQVGLGIEPFGGRFRLASPAAAAETVLVVPEWTRSLPSAASTIPTADFSTSASLGTLGPEVGDVPFSAAGPAPLRATATGDDGRAPGSVAWTQWVLGAWLAVGALLLLVLVGARRRLHDRLADRRRIEDGPLPGLLALVRRRAGLIRPVRLTVSPRLEAPIAMGTFLPQVCLPPRALTGLSSAMQESMLAHEVAHIARFDPLWLGLCRLLETVFFFQPLNRLARKRLQECSEFLCDDLAVDYTGNRIDLARCLAEVAGWILGERRVITVCGMADRHSPLGERVERILDADSGQERRAHWLAPAGVALLSATVFVAPSFSFAAPVPDRAGEESAFDDPPLVSAPRPVLDIRALYDDAPTPAGPYAAAEELLASFDEGLGALDGELAHIRGEALELGAPHRLLTQVEGLEREVREARARNARIRELLAILMRSEAQDPGRATAASPQPHVNSATPGRVAPQRNQR